MTYIPKSDAERKVLEKYADLVVEVYRTKLQKIRKEKLRIKELEAKQEAADKSKPK